MFSRLLGCLSVCLTVTKQLKKLWMNVHEMFRRVDLRTKICILHSMNIFMSSLPTCNIASLLFFTRCLYYNTDDFS